MEKKKKKYLGKISNDNFIMYEFINLISVFDLTHVKVCNQKIEIPPLDKKSPFSIPLYQYVRHETKFHHSLLCF